MATIAELKEDQDKIFKLLGCYLKRWIFVLAVGIGASVLGFVGRAVWVTTERAHAVEIRQKLQTEAVNARLDQHEETQDKEYSALYQQMQKMDDKLDKVIDKLHARE